MSNGLPAAAGTLVGTALTAALALGVINAAGKAFQQPQSKKSRSGRKRRMQKGGPNILD